METTTALLFTAYMIPVSLLDNALRPVVMGPGPLTLTAGHSDRSDRRDHFLRHYRTVFGPHHLSREPGAAPWPGSGSGEVARARKPRMFRGSGAQADQRK